MISFLKKSFLVLATLFIIGAPSFLFAQQNPNDINYTPLVVLPGVGQTDTDVELRTYIPGMFRLAIGIAGALAVLMIVIGGVEYITSESLGGKSDGRERINNAIIGLILAIGSYAILATISPNSLEFNLSGFRTPPTGTSQPTSPGSCPVNPCSLSSACPTDNTCSVSSTCTKVCTPTGGPVTTGPCIGSACYSQYPAGTAWPDDSTERGQLVGFDFFSTKTGGRNCTKSDEDGCTTVYKIGSQAISGLQSLRSRCAGCSLVITGGSEFWEHSTHGIGQNRVDLDYSAGDALDRHIRTNGSGPSTSNTCFSGQPAWTLNGAVYVLENNNHWHICYSQSVFN